MAASDTFNKIAVVPLEMLNQLNQTRTNYARDLFAQPELPHLRNLDEDLKRILADSTLAPDIKYRKYVDLFNQYSTLLTQLKKPLQIQIQDKSHSNQNLAIQQENPRIIITQPTQNEEIAAQRAPIAAGTEPTFSPTFSQDDLYFQRKRFEEILQRIPPKAQDTAQNLIDSISKNENIEWDEKGNVYVRKKKIERANIYKVMEDFMMDRKRTSTGFDQIAWELQDANFGRENIINKKGWDKAIRVEQKFRQMYPKDDYDGVKELFYNTEDGLGQEETNLTVQKGSGQKVGRNGRNNVQPVMLCGWEECAWKK